MKDRLWINFIFFLIFLLFIHFFHQYLLSSLNQIWISMDELFWFQHDSQLADIYLASR